MAAAKIEFAELGFIFFKKDVFLGSCAYTTPYFLESLNIPKSIKIGVMINALKKIFNRYY